MQKQEWELLCALHKYQSLSKASEALFVSQPALTRRLRQIEEEFQTVITLRTSKGLVFTPQGEALVAYCREMLRRYEQLKDSLKTEDGIAGTLRIACSLSQTQFFLPGLLEQFRRSYPHVSFEVESNFSSQNAEAVNSHKVLVAFFRGDFTGSFQKDLLMCQNAYIVCTHPFTLEQLPEMPRISFNNDHSTNCLLKQWWYDHFDYGPYITMNVSNGDICYEMMRHGLGYGIFLSTNYWFHNKDLYYQQMLFKNGMPVERRDWISYWTESLKLKSVKTFVDFTKDYATLKAAELPSPGIKNF